MTALTGMDRTSGKVLSGNAHLVQSLRDLISTPIGSRLWYRDYGCLLSELVDRPANRATLLLCSMAIAIAIARWEPRITVRRVALSGDLASGQATAEIDGVLADQASNALTRLQVPLARLPI